MNPTVTPEPVVDLAEVTSSESIPTESTPAETAPPAVLDERGDVPYSSMENRTVF